MDLTVPMISEPNTLIKLLEFSGPLTREGCLYSLLWTYLFTALCMYSIFSETSLRDNYTLIATSFRSSQPCSWETAIFRQSCSCGTAIFSEFYFWGQKKKKKPFLYPSTMPQDPLAVVDLHFAIHISSLHLNSLKKVVLQPLQKAAIWAGDNYAGRACGRQNHAHIL